jgi:hypothetical protein
VCQVYVDDSELHQLDIALSLACLYTHWAVVVPCKVYPHWCSNHPSHAFKLCVFEEKRRESTSMRRRKVIAHGHMKCCYLAFSSSLAVRNTSVEIGDGYHEFSGRYSTYFPNLSQIPRLPLLARHLLAVSSWHIVRFFSAHIPPSLQLAPE